MQGRGAKDGKSRLPSSMLRLCLDLNLQLMGGGGDQKFCKFESDQWVQEELREEGSRAGFSPPCCPLG